MADVEKGNAPQSNEVDRCGFCNRPKRSEKSTLLLPDACECPSAADSSDLNIRVGSVPSSAFRRSSQLPPQEVTVAETNLGLVEIISVREKHGYFRKAIPNMPLPIAVILCLFNVLIPGSGTIISVFAILCGCKTEHGSKRKSTMISLMAAFLQLVSAPIVVGWIWSVLWGITFVNISTAKDMEENHPNSML